MGSNIRKCRLNCNWNRAEHSALFAQLRTNKEKHTPVGKALLRTVLVFPAWLSVANFLISKEHDGEAELRATPWMDYYIAGWAIGLTFILWRLGLVHNISSLPRWAAWPIVVLVGYRILDSISYRLYYIFFKSIWKPWRDSRRSLGIAFANVYEVVIGYAILYLISNEIVDTCGKTLSSGFTAAYYSFVTITTLGYGDYAPSGWLSRGLVIAELLTGLTFLIVIIPSLVSLISESGKRLAGTYPAVEVENEIRRRAHKIHELHGGNGCALEDWLEAEAEFFGINEAVWLERCFDSVAMKWRYLFRRLLNTML